MAVVFKGKHHRNPSGLHNKVKWILSESNWKLDKYREIKRELTCTYPLKLFESKETPNPNHNGLNDIVWMSSWNEALAIARYIITGTKESYFYPHPWLKEFDED